jgi:hypothetical protein
MANDINPPTQSELLTALDALILKENPMLRDDDVTVARLATRAHWSKRRAREIIDKWVNEGLLEPLGKLSQAGSGPRIEAWRLKA